jgi:hypothetical protein
MPSLNKSHAQSIRARAAFASQAVDVARKAFDETLSRISARCISYHCGCRTTCFNSSSQVGMYTSCRLGGSRRIATKQSVIPAVTSIAVEGSNKSVLKEHSRHAVAKRATRLYDHGPDLAIAPVEQLPAVATPPRIGQIRWGRPPSTDTLYIAFSAKPSQRLSGEKNGVVAAGAIRFASSSRIARKYKPFAFGSAPTPPNATHWPSGDTARTERMPMGTTLTPCGG